MWRVLHFVKLWYTALVWSLAFAWGVGSILGGTVISEWHPTDSRASNNLELLKNLTEYLADIPEILHLCDDNDEGGADNVFLIPKPLTN